MCDLHTLLFILPLLGNGTHSELIEEVNSIIMTCAHTHLFPSKYMLVEVKLQLFISYVDTQLLKRVGTEILEPKDVQNSDISYILFPTERKVCT